MSGASAVQKHLLAGVLQNRCQACNFIKKRLQHRCFPMKFTKSLRTPFFTEHLYSDDCFSKSCWQCPILVTLHEKARSSCPGVFYKKGVFENFANQRCFPVNFGKFSRTPFFIEHLQWLLLKS